MKNETAVPTPDPRMPLTPEQLALIPLRHGSHDSREDGVCLLEAEAWAAGKPHTDADRDVCPVLARFCRALNDRLADDAERELLKPLVFKLINTRRSRDIEIQRIYAIGDWFLRDSVPAYLDLAAVAELLPFATELRALPAIVDQATAEAAREVIARALDLAIALDLALALALALDLDLDLDLPKKNLRMWRDGRVRSIVVLISRLCEL